jgi:hypothetical protein
MSRSSHPYHPIPSREDRSLAPLPVPVTLNKIGRLQTVRHQTPAGQASRDSTPVQLRADQPRVIPPSLLASPFAPTLPALPKAPLPKRARSPFVVESFKRPREESPLPDILRTPLPVIARDDGFPDTFLNLPSTSNHNISMLFDGGRSPTICSPPLGAGIDDPMVSLILLAFFFF